MAQHPLKEPCIHPFLRLPCGQGGAILFKYLPYSLILEIL